MCFGPRLKELRLSKNINQTDLALEIKKSPRQIRYYESGKSEPTLSVLISLSNIFNVSIDYLAGLTDNPEINR